jgi:hypothetical protein
VALRQDFARRTNLHTFWLGLILRLTKYVTEEDFQGRAESMGNKFSIDLTIIAKNIELPQVSDGE